MKKRIFTALLSLIVFVTAMPDIQVSAEESNSVGKTYYVSTIDGNDTNDGLSENKAFYSLQKINDITLQPGDKVLLEAGSVFTNGYLHIEGSGSAEAPIIIDRYGEGADPRIDTNGQGIWYQDYGVSLDNPNHKYKGYVSSSILLHDVEYIEIRNLEITNEAPAIEATYNYEHVMNRTGIAAVAQNIGTVDHIVLEGLTVHDVIGNVYDKHMNNGGIYFTVAKPLNESATGVSRYDDVVIQNCIVKDVNRWGIAVGYTAYHAKFNPAAIADDVIAEYGSGNVVIRNNYLEEIGGDAITLMYCDRPLIEYNVSKGAAKQINTTDYSATGSGRVAAGIWPWKCKDAIFQYNECYDMYPNQDGQAWDADYGDGTVYQYNYSHNNGGGCVMFCGIDAINNIFRYNISYKDLGGVMNNAGNPDAHVYNNTFYIKEGVDFIRTNMGGGPMVLENNIFYYTGSEAKTEEWYKHGNQTKYVYNNNLYYGYTNTPEGDKNAIVADPKFVEAAEAPTTYTGKSPLEGELITYSTATTFDMFKLQEGSPAINAGVYIANNGGKDFYGNPVAGVPDIGAYDSGTASVQLASSVYDVNQTEKTITVSQADKVTVRTLLENLEKDAQVKVTVTRNGKEITSGVRLEEGDVVTASYNGTETAYTIRVTASVNTDEVPVADIQNVFTGSAQSGEEGIKALDGNISTMWHTDWDGCTADEKYITLELGKDYVISGYKYTPRQSSVNGLITKYQILISNDNSTWTKVAEGTWTYETRDCKTVTFEPVRAKYVRLFATETQSDNASAQFASAAEVRLIGEVFYEDTTAPSKPELKAGAVTKNSVELSWTASTDNVAVTDYELYCGAEKMASFDADVTAYTATGLTAGTSYTFSVYALDKAGNQSQAGTVQVTTVAETVVCKHATTEVTGKVNATCTKEGYTGDTVCTVCKAVVKAGQAVAKAAHTWDKGKVTAPTATKKGVKTYTCTVCKTTKKETVEVKKGLTFTNSKDKATYKVTKAGKNGTVTFVKTKSTAKTITVPATVKIAGVNYKVTAIEKNAFKNNKKANKIVIGKNVSKIGATAFQNCTKLKEIQIQSTTLKKSGLTKTTFRGVKKSVKVTVPKAKVKAYKTLFQKNAGLDKKVKVVKGK